MQVKSKAEIEAAVAQARGAVGFAAPAGDDAAERISAFAARYSGYSTVEALPVVALIELALQVLKIVFDGEFTVEKLLAVIELIRNIFTV